MSESEPQVMKPYWSVWREKRAQYCNNQALFHRLRMLACPIRDGNGVSVLGYGDIYVSVDSQKTKTVLLQDVAYHTEKQHRVLQSHPNIISLKTLRKNYPTLRLACDNVAPGIVCIVDTRARDKLIYAYEVPDT